MASGISGGVDGSGEAMMGEEAAEADERDSSAGSGGGAREFGGLGDWQRRRRQGSRRLGGGGRRWRWRRRQRGKRVSLCYYAFSILFESLLFIYL